MNCGKDVGCVCTVWCSTHRFPVAIVTLWKLMVWSGRKHDNSVANKWKQCKTVPFLYRFFKIALICGIVDFWVGPILLSVYNDHVCCTCGTVRRTGLLLLTAEGGKLKITYIAVIYLSACL